MKELKINYTPTEESKELALYIENTGRLYQNRTKYIILNLAKKYAKGTFETEKALKLFYDLASEGAKMYAKEFASVTDWNRIFSVANRKATACQLLEGYFENINGENPL